MRQVIIDNQTFEVPEMLTGHEIRDLVKVEPDSTVVAVRNGKHQVIEDGEVIDVRPGDRFGTVRPFTTGGRR